MTDWNLEKGNTLYVVSVCGRLHAIYKSKRKALLGIYMLLNESYYDLRDITLAVCYTGFEYSKDCEAPHLAVVPVDFDRKEIGRRVYC